MAKIPVSSLLTDFRRMAQENWAYVAGGSATGQVDCSGAFVWAFRQHGCSIYHGSNRIARTEVIDLTPIERAEHIVPGMVAFKCRQPGLFSGYDLPDDYLMNGEHYNGDLGDYYHVGLVADNPKQVYNAQSSKTGFVTSDISKGWTHVGYLKQVDYGADQPITPDTPADPPVQQPTTSTPAVTTTTATVIAESGTTVNLRKKADKHAALVERVPIGATVEVTGTASGGWYPVKWGKYSGYMMADFLAVQSTAGTNSGGTIGGGAGTNSGGTIGGGAGTNSGGTIGGGAGTNWAVTIYDLSEAAAREIAAQYASANVFETVG